MSKHPIGFMSYVRFDDQHDNGRLSQFCARLSGEVQLQTGEQFHIFQDRNDIRWGQQWKQRIDRSLDVVTFLISILTPGFFKSVACREELERFLERENRLRREDLILPVYYCNCPVLINEEKCKTDPLAKIIAARQYADWRELRFEPFTSPQVGKMLAKMASQIVEAIEQGQPIRKIPLVSSRVPSEPRKSSSLASLETVDSPGQLPDIPSRPTLKTEISILVVDALHRGDYSSLTDALKVAKPGDRILVRPGLYREGIVINKPVEIIGDGERGDVVIEGHQKTAVRFQANMGRIANLTLRQLGDKKWFCVDIAQGRLDLEGCDISSQSLSCVAIHGGADPRLRGNRIHDGKQSGVYVYENGLGTLEDNDIFANGNSGVAISKLGNPTLRRNRIHDGKRGGVYVYENGLGTLEDNDIFANGTAGVAISGGGNPTLRRNHIHDGKKSGVHVYENGLGTLEDNDIFANGTAGVAISGGGNPTLRHNRIMKNNYEAIWIYKGGQGIIENNDLRENKKGAWHIESDCEDKVKRSGNQE